MYKLEESMEKIIAIVLIASLFAQSNIIKLLLKKNGF